MQDTGILGAGRPAHWRAHWVVAVVVAALAAMVASPSQVGAAQASASDGQRAAGLIERLSRAVDPPAAYSQLSSEDQAAVRVFLTVVSIDGVSTLTTEPGEGREPVGASITCWTWTWQRDGKNIFGETLWSYFQRIDWCGNGSTITISPHGVQRTRWGEVYVPFWQWRHIGSQTWGGVGQQTYRAWTQAEFKLCLVPEVGCVQYAYPWLDMTAWADGRGTGSVGG